MLYNKPIVQMHERGAWSVLVLTIIAPPPWRIQKRTQECTVSVSSRSFGECKTYLLGVLEVLPEVLLVPEHVLLDVGLRVVVASGLTRLAANDTVQVRTH